LCSACPFLLHNSDPNLLSSDAFYNLNMHQNALPDSLDGFKWREEKKGEGKGIKGSMGWARREYQLLMQEARTASSRGVD